MKIQSYSQTEQLPPLPPADDAAMPADDAVAPPIDAVEDMPPMDDAVEDMPPMDDAEDIPPMDDELGEPVGISDSEDDASVISGTIPLDMKGIFSLVQLLNKERSSVNVQDIINSITEITSEPSEVSDVYQGMAYIGKNLDRFDSVLATVGEVGNAVDWDIEKMKEHFDKEK